jgi:hypothetical protein
MAFDGFPDKDMTLEVVAIEIVRGTKAHDHAAEEMAEAAMC